MSANAVEARVKVYEKDRGEWGQTDEKVVLKTYWNDEAGSYVVIEVGGHSYTVPARNLRAAIAAVTSR